MSRSLKPKPLFLVALGLIAMLAVLFTVSTQAFAADDDGTPDQGKGDKPAKVEDRGNDDNNGRGRDDHPINCDGDNSGPYRDVCDDDDDCPDGVHHGRGNGDDDDCVVVPNPKPNQPPVVVVDKDIDVDIEINNVVVHTVHNVTVNNVVQLINNGVIVVTVGNNNTVNSNNGNVVGNTVNVVDKRRGHFQKFQRLVFFTTKFDVLTVKVFINGHMTQKMHGHGKNSIRTVIRVPQKPTFRLRVCARIRNEETGKIKTWCSRERVRRNGVTVIIDP